MGAFSLKAARRLKTLASDESQQVLQSLLKALKAVVQALDGSDIEDGVTLKGKPDGDESGFGAPLNTATVYMDQHTLMQMTKAIQTLNHAEDEEFSVVISVASGKLKLDIMQTGGM